MKWSSISKALAAAASAAAVAIAAGLLDEHWSTWVTGVIGVLVTFVGTYVAPANSSSTRLPDVPPAV